MKIRWTGDSIRLRITPSELEALQRSEIVRERLSFASRENGWSAAILPGVATTSVQLVGGSLLLRLSNADLHALAEPESEGVYFQENRVEAAPTGSSTGSSIESSSGEAGVRYYIEKDFPCVHPRAIEVLETPTETFPAPEGFEQRKV